MSSKRRLSQNITASSNKLRLDSLNKIFKIDRKQSIKHKRHKTIRQVSRVALSELLKNPPTKFHEIPDFKTFLDCEDHVRIFRDFLKEQYCQENLDFYLACEKFKQLDTEKVGKDFVRFMATQIFNDFVGPDASPRININYDCFKNIDQQMKDPKPDLFCDAQIEIFNLMRDDCYKRFCKTWEMDRGTAEKILSQRQTASVISNTPRQKSTLSSAKATPISDGNITALSLDTSSSQFRGTKRKAYPTQSDNNECPVSCPYFKVGLPCQLHNIDEENRIEHTGCSDFIDKINFARIHHVPNCCTRKTPPPPPIPPRTYRTVKPIPPKLSKKFCPYVSEPLDV